MKPDRSLWPMAVIVGSICLLPVVVFMLIALWPQRVLVSWLLLGLVALFVLVGLVLWVVRIGTVARLRLREEKLRKDRLYANERLVEHERPYNDERAIRQQQMVRDDPFVHHPYIKSPYRREYDPYEPQNVPYDGLQPLSIDRYKWEDEK